MITTLFRFISSLFSFFLQSKPDVSAGWLRDNERRACGRGIEQSRSTWPWRGWDR